METRTLDPQLKEQEAQLDITLRPQNLNDFVGHTSLKETLNVFIQAAKQRHEPLDHTLFYGAPGLGKTTLAYIIAKEMGVNIKVTSGPAIDKVGDLAAILTNLQAHDILFIDEIHRMNRTIEEIMYPAMEDSALDLIVGKGPAARTLRMQLHPFTLIGATTKMNLISSPLRDRFGAQFHLDYYTENDIARIIQRSALILKIELHEMAEKMIASRARRTPRVANRLLKRVRDFAQVQGNGTINSEICDIALNQLQVDMKGLDTVDRLILETIIEKYAGGPVGLSTLAAAVAEDTETLESIYEPFLLQMGFIERTPRGRCATKLAYTHLNRTLLDIPTQKILV